MVRLTDRITIVRAVTGRDAHGNQAPDWARATRTFGVPADVQPAAAVEQTADRQTTLTRWNIVVPPGTDVRAQDRIEWRGWTLEIDGEPRRWDRRAVAHHVELAARAVEG